MPLILHNAGVLTMDYLRPLAQAVAVEDECVIAAGSSDAVSTYRTGDTIMFDCRGGALLPGFIDAHCHLLAYAASLLSVDAGPAAVSSIAGIQKALRGAAAATPPGGWLRAAGYDETDLAEKRHPTRWDLDAAAPDHPVRLLHRSGHACVLNSLALKLAGISGETEEPPGGCIERDLATGEPSGLLIEMNEMVDPVVPPLGYDELARGVDRASRVLLSKGVTSIQDTTATNGPAEWELFRRLIEEGHLPLGVTLMEGFPSLGQLPESALDDRLRRGAVKIAVKELGDRIHPGEDDLAEMVWQAHSAGRQVAVHAVEERAVAAAVAAVERALERLPVPDHRHRIEHCGICPPDLVHRIARAGIAVVTQPLFLYHSGDRYLAHVKPESLPYLYPLRSLLVGGVPLAAGSDAPVVPPSPLRSLQAAALRRSRSGAPITPAEAIGTKEALRMHTLNGAWVAFEDGRRGTIAPGKDADLVLLSGHPLETESGEVTAIRVEATFVRGRRVFSSDAPA